MADLPSPPKHLPQVVDSAANGAGVPAVHADLHQHIQQTLTRIRSKQFALQEQNYTHRQMRQRLDQLTRHVTQIEQLQQQVDLDGLGLQVYAEDLAEIRSFTNHIAEDLARSNGVSEKIVSLNLQNAFELLRRLLDEMQADVRWPKANAKGRSPEYQSAETEIDRNSEQLQILRLTLNQQRQHLSNSFLGKVLRSSIAMRLNRLAGLLHRIDGLSHRPSRTVFARHQARPQEKQSPRQQQLRALVHQIDQAVDRLDFREASAPDLLEDTEVLVERRIHRYEYPLGFGWVLNRFRDINRYRSPQARVLAGLSTSLSVTLILFVASFGVFSLVSRNLESNVLVSLRLREERSEKLQTLSQEMRSLRNKEKERAANQTSLDSLQVVSSEDGAAAAEPSEAAGATEANPGSESPSLGDADDGPLDLPEVSNPEATRDILLETDQALTSEIQALRTTVDQQLNEISALSEQIEEARQTEESNASLSSATDEQSLKNLYSWLNNQQIIDHLNRIILAAFAGALGSMMSILIRLDKLDDENLNNPYALGFLKPFIGAVFGVIVFAVLSTKVVDILPAGFNIHEEMPTGSAAPQWRDPLGDIDSQEIYKIFVAAFIAGFSERLANDTLRSFK